MIIIKSEEEIKRMREAALIAADAMDEALVAVQPGVRTAEIDAIVYHCIVKAGATPSFKGYNGFPGTACISINEEIVHGIPGNRKLKEGDIVSIDLGAYLHGYHSDMARTVGVGEISEQAKKLIEVTKSSFFKGIEQAVAGKRIIDIGRAIENYATKNHTGVIRDFIGHGIGQSLHEEPDIPNYASPRKGPVLRAGMVLAIEPMLSLGSWETKVADNGWTASTKDGSLAAHYENTVVVTADGPCRILTIR